MKNKKIKKSTIIYAAILIVMAFLAMAGILIYGFGMDNAFTQIFARIIPYPAAIVNSTHFISVSELQNNLQSVRKFYENQNFSEAGLRVDFSTENGRKRLLIKKKDVLNKLIENKIIEILANKRGISITKEMITQALDQEVAQYGDKNAMADNLQKLYGWNIEDFKEKMVRPDLYKEALGKYVQENDPDMQKAKAKISQAADELKNRKDFSAVAEQYSEGDSAKNGGDLGWFGADQMLPQLSQAAFSLSKGQTSDIIESPLGYHIIIVDDKKSENGVDQVKIRQIFARSENFSGWLSKQEKNFKIFIPLKDFYWNSESGGVEFRNPEMKKFEDNLDKNSTGDASVLF